MCHFPGCARLSGRYNFCQEHQMFEFIFLCSSCASRKKDNCYLRRFTRGSLDSVGEHHSSTTIESSEEIFDLQSRDNNMMHSLLSTALSIAAIASSVAVTPTAAGGIVACGVASFSFVPAIGLSLCFIIGGLSYTATVDNEIDRVSLTDHAQLIPSMSFLATDVSHSGDHGATAEADLNDHTNQPDTSQNTKIILKTSSGFNHAGSSICNIITVGSSNDSLNVLKEARSEGSVSTSNELSTGMCQSDLLSNITIGEIETSNECFQFPGSSTDTIQSNHLISAQTTSQAFTPSPNTSFSEDPFSGTLGDAGGPLPSSSGIQRTRFRRCCPFQPPAEHAGNLKTAQQTKRDQSNPTIETFPFEENKTNNSSASDQNDRFAPPDRGPICPGDENSQHFQERVTSVFTISEQDVSIVCCHAFILSKHCYQNLNAYPFDDRQNNQDDQKKTDLCFDCYMATPSSLFWDDRDLGELEDADHFLPHQIVAPMGHNGSHIYFLEIPHVTDHSGFGGMATVDLFRETVPEGIHRPSDEVLLGMSQVDLSSSITIGQTEPSNENFQFPGSSNDTIQSNHFIAAQTTSQAISFNPHSSLAVDSISQTNNQVMNQIHHQSDRVPLQSLPLKRIRHRWNFDVLD